MLHGLRYEVAHGLGLPPLVRVIGLLADAAAAPRAQWPRFAEASERVARVATAEGGAAAAMLAVQARALLRQMPRTQPECETELRGIARALACVLQIELNHHRGDKARPYYARD